MECVTPPRNPHSSTGKPFLHNHDNTMKKWQDFVFKLAQGHPNAPLPQAAETLLRDRLHRLVSDYITPEHPPYSAMIENALQELNEKGGSSEESIARYLEKKYDKLPWAPSALLKHHLEKACESGDIVVTRAKKYRLAGSLNLSTKSKSKQQQSRARWECKKRQNKPLKIRFIKKRYQQRGERVEVNKKYQECDENEQRLTENGVHSEDEEDQEKSFPSCVDVEKSSRGDPSILLTEPLGMIAAANEKEFPEEVRSKLENGPSAIVEYDIWAAHSQEHQEKEQSEHGQPEPVTPERPPGFESFRDDNLPEPRAVNITSSELVTTPKAGEYDSLQSEHNMETTPNEQEECDLVPVTLKQIHHEKQQPQLIQADVVEVAQSVTKDTKLMRDGRCGCRGYYEPKEHVFEPHMTIDSSNLCLTSNESEFALSTEHELLQQPRSQQEKTFHGKLRRSPRDHPSKPEVAKDTNTVDILPPECSPNLRPLAVGRRLGRPLKQRPRGHPAKPEVAKDTNTVDVLPPECSPNVRSLAVGRRLGRPLKQRPSNQPPPKPKRAASVGELQDQPKSKRRKILLKQKPNAASAESLKVEDECREQDFTQSGKEAEFTSMHENLERDASKLPLQEVQNKPRRGRPPKRRFARLLKIES